MSNNLNFLATIELPRLYDNLTTAVNKYNPQQMWALDTTGSFESKAAVLYELPIGQGQHWMNTGAALNTAAAGRCRGSSPTTTLSRSISRSRVRAL